MSGFSGQTGSLRLIPLVQGKALPRILLALTLGLVFWAGSFVWQDRLGNLTDDSVSYLLMAQCASPYESVSAARQEACATEHYPPIFPWIVALTGASEDFARAHLVVHLCLLGAAFFLYGLAASLSKSEWLAFVTVLVFLATPLTWVQLPAVLSENLYLLLTLLALWLYRCVREPPPASLWLWAALTLVLTAVLLTRTIGVMLGLSMGLAFVFAAGDQRRAGLAATGIALALAACWYLYRPPGSEISYLSDINGGLAQLMGGDFDAPKGIVANLANLGASWLAAFLVFWTAYWSPGVVVFAVFGLFALGGAVRHGLAGRPEGFYVLGSLGVLAVWPYPGQMPRFLYGLLPLLILLGFDSIKWMGERLGSRWRPYPMFVLTAAAGVFLLPGLSFIEARYQSAEAIPGYDLSLTSAYYRTPDRGEAVAQGILEQVIAKDLRWIERNTPQDARILWFSRSYIPLLADRRQAILPATENVAELKAFVAASGVDYIYLSRLHPRYTLSSHNGLAWYSRFADWTERIHERRIGAQEAVVSMVLRVKDSLGPRKE